MNNGPPHEGPHRDKIRRNCYEKKYLSPLFPESRWRAQRGRRSGRMRRFFYQHSCFHRFFRCPGCLFRGFR